jgi:hypothetical protein
MFIFLQNAGWKTRPKVRNKWGDNNWICSGFNSLRREPKDQYCDEVEEHSYSATAEKCLNRSHCTTQLVRNIIIILSFLKVKPNEVVPGDAAPGVNGGNHRN